MPLASLPAQISGRNRVWRRVVDRRDPQRSGVEGRRLHHAAAEPAHGGGRCCGSSAATRSSASGRSPTLAQADAEIDDYVAELTCSTGDANDMLYALESSRDYDPGPGLERITAPLLAINSADDLVNPPELGILEREITRVPHGRAVDDPAERQDRRPRHAHDGGGVEAVSGRSR